MLKILNNKSSQIDMCNGNLFIKIIQFCIPLILMGILSLLFNTADLIVVSNFSGDEDALGAVGSTTSLVNFSINVFMGLSVGTNVVCARYIGAKDYNSASRVVHTSILLSAIIGTLVGLIGFLLTDQLLTMMHNDLSLSRTYLRIYFLGMPFNLVYNFAAAILRANGDTRKPLYFLLIAGTINVILNLIFVIVFKMSVAGVATATVISQFISFVLIIITLLKTNECYKLYLKKLRIYKKELKEILIIGIPAGIQSSLFSISNIIIQSTVNMFGSAVMSGNSAASNIESYVYTAMNSVYHASISFTGQNVGAKKSKNIRKVTAYSLLIVVMIAVLFGGTLFLLRYPLVRIYTRVPDEINVGIIRLHYLCLPYFLCGIMDVMTGILRGLGLSISPAIVTIGGICGFRLIWIYFVFRNITDFNTITDLNYLYVSYPISWIITFIILLIIYLFSSKKKFMQMEFESQML